MSKPRPPIRDAVRAGIHPGISECSFFRASDEMGTHEGLVCCPAVSPSFPDNLGLKGPHGLEPVATLPTFATPSKKWENSYAYFVHSYYCSGKPGRRLDHG
jgi:imidazoleglycerol phosphate synthase glutamine amidotransferase subunit HisH